MLTYLLSPQRRRGARDRQRAGQGDAVQRRAEHGHAGGGLGLQGEVGVFPPAPANLCIAVAYASLYRASMHYWLVVLDFPRSLCSLAVPAEHWVQQICS